MIRIRHHNGQERLINLHAIESVYADAAGFAVVRLSSGVEFTIAMRYRDFAQFIAEVDSISEVRGPEPEHPEIAQKGPLPPPAGEHLDPVRGIIYGTPGYREAKSQQD